MTTRIRRRTLVKGAAWTAPVIASSALVPAYAASKTQCSGTLVPGRSDGDATDTDADLGLLDFHRVSDTSFIGSTVNVGDAVLTGLPQDVTVTKLEMSIIFKTRTAPSYGLPALNQATRKTNAKYLPSNPDYRIAISANSKNQTGTNSTYWSRVAPSTSASSTVDYWDYTKNGTATATITRDLSIEHPDGNTYDSWQIEYPAWTSTAADGYRVGTYSDTSDGCRTFTMSEFGEMAIVYNNATPISYSINDDGSTQNYYNLFVRHRYTLSDGRVLVFDSWRNNYSPDLPSSESRMYYE